jgi:ADP-ribose pyrophosphatase YjhB (NUDIX family)
MTRRDVSTKTTPKKKGFEVRPVVYTQQSAAGKGWMRSMLKTSAYLTRIWLRVFGPHWTVGCLSIIRDEHSRVCLLKHKGRVKPWGLPGGLVAWPETPEQGLHRELREELGWPSQETVQADVGLRLFRVCTSEKFPMLELVFAADRTATVEEISSWKIQASEISEVRWFTREEISSLEGILERHRELLLSLQWE